MKALETLATFFSGKGVTSPLIDAPALDYAGKVFFIDVPESKQSVLYIGKLMPDSLDPEFNKISYTNEKLGGGISGDLSQTLRISKGYTYGAYSGMTQGKTRQGWRITTSVRANATEPSLGVIKDMLEAYGPTFDDAARELTVNKRLKSNTRAFESVGAKLGILKQISRYGKSKTYIEDEQDILMAMTTEDFQNMAKTYFQEKDMVYIIVGDKKTQMKPVQDFANGPVIELDIFGNPVN